MYVHISHVMNGSLLIIMYMHTHVHTYVLVSWLRGGSKEKLYIHKPCSTGQ